jgi:hypothetical protein
LKGMSAARNPVTPVASHLQPPLRARYRIAAPHHPKCAGIAKAHPKTLA